MHAERIPLDLAAFEQRIRTDGCFVCGVVAGDPAHDYEQVVFEDDAHILQHQRGDPVGGP